MDRGHYYRNAAKILLNWADAWENWQMHGNCWEHLLYLRPIVCDAVQVQELSKSSILIALYASADSIIFLCVSLFPCFHVFSHTCTCFISFPQHFHAHAHFIMHLPILPFICLPSSTYFDMHIFDL